MKILFNAKYTKYVTCLITVFVIITLWQLFRKKQTWGQGPRLWPEHRALHLYKYDG